MRNAISFVASFTLAIAVLAGCARAQTPTINPPSPSAGAPGSTLTVTGTNFGDPQSDGEPPAGASVTFDSSPVTDIKSWSRTSITVTVPNVVPKKGVKISVNGSASQSFQVTLPTIAITANPQVISPANGKLPSSINLTVLEKNCDSKKGIDLTQGNAPYTLTISGSGLAPSAQPTSGRCSISSTLAIDPNTPAATYEITLQDKDKNPVGTAEISVMDISAGPIPPGLAPQVDVLWEVMSQKNCSDVFGSRVAERLYCIQLKIGNNSGYGLQVAGIGFSTQLDALKGSRNNDGTITIANSSYAATRAVLLTENVTSGRNIAYNVLQAAGVLMSGFTPYFGTGKHPNGTVNNARTNWTTAAALVSGPLLSAFNIVAPNPVITQLNNLDDQSFRDSKLIANNNQIQTVVFVEKQALTYQVGALCGQYPDLGKYVQHNKQQTTTGQQGSTCQQEGQNSLGYSTYENSKNARRKISFSRGNFSPFLVKLALGSVVIVGDQIQYLQRVQIQNTATPPATTGPLAAKPSSLSFPSGTNGVTVGTPQTITLTNTGATTSLTAITPQITGTNSGDFSLGKSDTACPSPLAPSGTCTVSVTYSPSPGGVGGTRTASLQITYGPGSTPLGVALTGAASETVYFPSTALSLPAAKVGTPTTASLTIINFKNTAITLSYPVSGTNQDEFNKTAPKDSCHMTVAVGGSCTITVTFTPAKAGEGARTATMTVTGTTAGGAVTQPVSLTGTGQ